MSSHDALQQNNDQKIEVPITFNGALLDMPLLTNATYKLYSLNKKTVLVEKSLNSGITNDNSHLSIHITADECKSLRGIYYHELTIEHSDIGRATAFKKEIHFEATNN